MYPGTLPYSNVFTVSCRGSPQCEAESLQVVYDTLAQGLSVPQYPPRQRPHCHGLGPVLTGRVPCQVPLLARNVAVLGEVTRTCCAEVYGACAPVLGIFFKGGTLFGSRLKRGTIAQIDDSQGNDLWSRWCSAQGVIPRRVQEWPNSHVQHAPY